MESRLLFERVCLVPILNLECTDAEASRSLWKRGPADKPVATLGLSEGREHHGARVGRGGLMGVEAVLRIFPLSMWKY